MTIQYKSFVLFGLLTIIAQTLTAQTYCMKYGVVRNSNNTIDVTVRLIASGNVFKLGSGNLQFKYKAAVLSTPTLVSEALSSTNNYNGITVTEPTSLSLEGTGDALVSFNYNFISDTDKGFPIGTSEGITIAVIRFQILDATLSPNIRPYDNGSRGTVVFNDNALSPTLLSSTGNCFVYDFAPSVEWLPIKAYPTPLAEKKTISVDWATAFEKGNSHFVVERGFDGQTFSPIGTVKAANKASTYHFIDEKPVKTLNFYRIRQIDLNGSESLSKTDSASLKSQPKLSIYPSPTQGVLSIETDDTSTYTVINALGQQVLSGPITKQLDVSDLASDTYFLKVGAEQVKFVKQ